MKICRFDDPKRFQDRIQEFLVEHEAENNLPLGILNNLIAGEYRSQEPYLAILEENDSLILSVLCTPPFQALFSYLDPLPSDKLLKLSLNDLMDFFGNDFAGISANKKLASRLREIWQEMTGKEIRQYMAMRIYKVDEVLPTSTVGGSIRPANRSDRELMIDWYSGFHREAMQEESDLVRVQKQVDTYLTADPKVRGLMFLEVEGVPVSMAGYAGPTPNGIRIGAVYSPPEYRKRGYASAVTAGVSQYLLDKGYKFCFLFTDLLNPTSNHIYQEIGYRPVCDVDRYDFK